VLKDEAGQKGAVSLACLTEMAAQMQLSFTFLLATLVTEIA